MSEYIALMDITYMFKYMSRSRTVGSQSMCNVIIYVLNYVRILLIVLESYVEML